MKTEICYASPIDAYAVADIYVAAWREAYREILPPAFLASLSVERREVMWNQIIGEGKPDLLVAKSGGTINGWLNFGASRDEGVPVTEAEVMAIYVSPSSWATGVGRQLWLRAKDIMVQQGYMTCSLWVFPQNLRAIRFYCAAGFALTPSSMKVFEVGGKECQEVRYSCHIDRK